MIKNKMMDEKNHIQYIKTRYVHDKNEEIIQHDIATYHNERTRFKYNTNKVQNIKEHNTRHIKFDTTYDTKNT